MSESARKSHIPDEKLAELTDHKLEELGAEREELHARLEDSESPVSDARDRIERQIENHDAAAKKLTKYRAEMLDHDDRASFTPPTTPSTGRVHAADAMIGEPGRNEEDRLDEALQETMPTSDPISIKIA